MSPLPPKPAAPPALWQQLPGKLSPGHWESGDLMLALLLFLIYRESGDETYLYALVLLFLF